MGTESEKQKSSNNHGSISVKSVRQLSPEELEARTRIKFDPAAHAVEMLTLQKQYTADAKLGARFSMKSMEVAADGESISVSARAMLYDSKPVMRHRWTLRVFDQSKRERLVNRHYDEQIFTLPEKKLIDPTFNEVVKIAPGDYWVELILHRVPEDFDLTTLDDKQVDREHRVLSRISKVKVPR